MPGEEREINVSLNLDVTTEVVMSSGSTAQQGGTHPNADSMKDYWSTTANKDLNMDEAEEEKESNHCDLRPEEEEEEAITDLHLQLQQENAALRPTYRHAEQLAKESSAAATMETEAQCNHINGTQHEFFKSTQQPYNLETTTESSGSEAVAPLGTLLPASTYFYFINGTYPLLATSRQPNSANAVTGNNIAGNERRFYTSPASTSEPNDNATSFPSVAGHLLTQITEGMNRDMDSHGRNFVFKCPDRSSDLQNTTAHSEEDLNVPRGGSASSGTGSSCDELGEPLHDQEQASHEVGAQGEMRAAIRDHPFYTEMVLSYLKILKIGAPKALRIKVEELTKKYQKRQNEELSTSDQSAADHNPELDYFMKSFVGMLTTLEEDLANPLNKFMAYKDSVSKQLEDICGHYVETGEDENETYGFEIEHLDGLDGLDGLDEPEDFEIPEPEMVFPTAGGDDSIVIDPNASEEELKKLLQKRYGKYIGGLKAEFTRARKKAKLPGNARHILKDWFKCHSFWPYPSENEKVHLQKVCGLNLKQINNWFINERKRHWSSEGKCMHPNTKFYDTDSTSEEKKEKKDHISDS